MTESTTLTRSPAWQALLRHYSSVQNTHLRDLFAADKNRGTRFVAEAAGLHLDYSKNLVTDETLALLQQLAVERRVPERIAAMWRGDKINVTEQRSVLHIALRAARSDKFMVDGVNVVPDVYAVLDRMSPVFRSRSQRRMERFYRQAHQKRYQYRHRRIRSRSGNGIRSVASLQRARHDIPFCLERRWNGFRRSGARSGTRRNALHHIVQNIHDARKNA